MERKFLPKVKGRKTDDTDLIQELSALRGSIDALTEKISAISSLQQRHAEDLASVEELLRLLAANQIMNAADNALIDDKDLTAQFSVILVNDGNKKTGVIKVIREATGLGLKAAKSILNTVPAIVKEKISKTDAEALKAKFEAVGATVIIKIPPTSK